MRTRKTRWIRQARREYARIPPMAATTGPLVDGGDPSVIELLVDRIRGGDLTAE